MEDCLDIEYNSWKGFYIFILTLLQGNKTKLKNTVNN